MITQDVFDPVPVFGEAEYQNQTTIHPLALAILSVLCVLTLLLPRKYALIPCMLLVCFIPTSQRIVIFGLDFTLLRIMAGVGWIRVLTRGEFHRGRWRRPDTVMLAWAAVSIGANVLLYQEADKLIYTLGIVTEALGLYFMVRSLVTTWTDLKSFSVVLVAICVVVAIAFMNEKATGYNAFSIFGGVPAQTIVREGRLRCQGAFPHAILAGCFWAVMAAYMLPLWWSKTSGGRLLSIAGMASSLLIIVACSSSTPVAALLAAAGAGAWFLFRHYSRPLRFAVVSGLIALHFVMKAPVWHLISRIDLAGGSTGYHRFLLIDATIRNFSEWALVGTKSTAHWGATLFDLTNQYVAEGVMGGALRLLLFLVLITMCFSRVGLIWQAVEKNPERLAMAWGLGVALFVHCVNFLGVSYFGQVSFGWYFSVAIIVSLSEPLDSQGRAQAMAQRGVPLGKPKGKQKSVKAGQAKGPRRSGRRPRKQRQLHSQ